MINAYLIPGFKPYRSFADPEFDYLRSIMKQFSVKLEGVGQPWDEHGIHEYGRLACEEIKKLPVTDVVIGHSLGSIAALAAIEEVQVQHLMLCSPSALFAEDFRKVLSPTLAEFIGKKRLSELSGFSAKVAANNVNRLGMPTTITFGTLEQDTNPWLVARAQQLARDITVASLSEVEGAEHSIRQGIYAHEVARLASTI